MICSGTVICTRTSTFLAFWEQSDNCPRITMDMYPWRSNCFTGVKLSLLGFIASSDFSGEKQTYNLQLINCGCTYSFFSLLLCSILINLWIQWCCAVPLTVFSTNVFIKLGVSFCVLPWIICFGGDGRKCSCLFGVFLLVWFSSRINFEELSVVYPLLSSAFEFNFPCQVYL